MVLRREYGATGNASHRGQILSSVIVAWAAGGFIVSPVITDVAVAISALTLEPFDMAFLRFSRDCGDDDEDTLLRPSRIFWVVSSSFIDADNDDDDDDDDDDEWNVETGIDTDGMVKPSTAEILDATTNITDTTLRIL